MSNTIINTNVLALNSHRALTGVGGTVAKSSERLSSGMRINRAADDAAGLAISEKMRSQIRGLDQATRNSQDGISLIQTAEGALQESQNMLQKMRELTVQASNDTNTAEDRDKIAGEIDELIDEIDSTAEKTEFNTKKLIDGSWKNQSLYLQTGANEGQGMEFNIEQMDAITLGTTKGSISSVIRGNGVDGDTHLDEMAAAGTANLGDKEIAGVYTYSGGASVEVLENGDLKVTGMKIGNEDAEKTYKLADIEAEVAANGSFTLTDADGGTFTVGGTSTHDAAATSTTATRTDIGTAITTDGDTFNGTVGSVTVDYEVTGTYDTDDATTWATDQTEVKFSNTTGAKFYEADGTEMTITDGTAYKASDLTDLAYMIDADGNKFTFDNDYGDFGVDGDGSSTTENGSMISVAGADGADVTLDATTLVALDPATGTRGAITDDLGSISVTVDNTDATTGSTTYAADWANDEATMTFDNIDGAVFMDANGEKVDIEAGKAYTKTDLTALGLTSMVDKDGNKFTLTANGDFGAAGDVAEKSVGFIASSDEAKAAVEDIAITGQTNGKVISGLTDTIDNALETVSAQRAKLGAYQNRLDYTINNLKTSSENLSASESRIRDTDMAKEMMNMTKANVLQQAATSMLAQANQAPQAILKLLG
jgi:flagellin